MTVKLTNVNPAIRAATAKAFGALTKQERNELEVGTYEVSANIQIKGGLVVGPDYDRKPTASIPLIATLALFAKRAGCTREATLAHLTEVLTEVLTNDADNATDAFVSQCNDIEAAIEDVREKVIDQLPKVATKGRTGFVVEQLNVVSSFVEHVPAA